MSTTLKPAVRAAKRLIDDYMKEAAVGEEANAGFDAGEWSGPAHADLQMQEEERLMCVVANKFSVPVDELIKAYDAEMYRYH